MTRAEKRRLQRDEAKEQVAYTLTNAQLETMINDRLKKEVAKAKAEATNDAINAAMTLLLTLPMEVLMDHYWQRSYSKKIPEFTSYVLEYYQKWQDGELDMEELKKDLWEYGGIRLEESSN